MNVGTADTHACFVAVGEERVSFMNTHQTCMGCCLFGGMLGQQWTARQFFLLVSEKEETAHGALEGWPIGALETVKVGEAETIRLS